MLPYILKKSFRKIRSFHRNTKCIAGHHSYAYITYLFFIKKYSKMPFKFLFKSTNSKYVVNGQQLD